MTGLLVAWCELRQDFRHFRVDRIVAADAFGEAIGVSRRYCAAAGSAWREAERGARRLD